LKTYFDGAQLAVVEITLMLQIARLAKILIIQKTIKTRWNERFLFIFGDCFIILMQFCHKIERNNSKFAFGEIWGETRF